MAKPQVLLLAGEFSPFTGGIAHAAAHLAKALRQEGCSVSVLAPRYGREDDTFDRRQPYRIRRLPLLRLRYVRMLPMTPVILALAMKERPDWVIAMRATREGLPAVAIKGLLGIPFLVFAHALEFLRFAPNSWGWRLCRKVYEQAERVMAISSATRTILVERGISAAKVQVVHLGISDAILEPVAPLSQWNGCELKGRRMLLTVGRLVPRKGVDKVLEALEAVLARHPEALYVVVGDGPYRSVLQQKAKQLGLTQHVLFAGRVPDVRPFYHACYAFVMPARQEGWGDMEGLGLVYLEAAACGKPVIASLVGGAADTFIPGETGLAVNPTDPQDIARALLQLLDDPELARRLGEAGKKWVLQQFRWKQTAQKVLALMGAQKNNTKT